MYKIWYVAKSGNMNSAEIKYPYQTMWLKSEKEVNAQIECYVNSPFWSTYSENDVLSYIMNEAVEM